MAQGKHSVSRCSLQATLGVVLCMIASIGRLHVAGERSAEGLFPFQDYTLPNSVRIEDFISRLTLQEKAEQLVSMSPSIPRLNWTAFNWRSECCHGWGFTGSDYEGSGWNGTASVFPQVIGMSASMDEELVQAIGHAAGMEGRAAYNNAKRQGIHGHMMTGLHCFGPTTNANHDPRWGRIKRTWGEDPFLTGTLASAHIKGLQGGDEKYMKMAADVNMFAVHSGPDAIRQHFDANVSDRELFDYYLPAFEQTVKEGQVSSVMVAYSAFRGIPDNCNPLLLTDVLLNRWNFSMISFSDNSGVLGIVSTQKYTSSYANASALSINAGLHQDMASGGPSSQGWRYGGCIWNKYLPQAVQAGLAKESELDAALRRVLGVRFTLGSEDPDWLVPFSDIGMDTIGCQAHSELAVQAARKSMVLLKNNKTLPLTRTAAGKILLVGPHVNSSSVYFGGTYSAFPARPTGTILEWMTQPSLWPATHGLHSSVKNMDVQYVPGCPEVTCPDKGHFAEAMAAAPQADFIVYVGGIDGSRVEREGGDRGTESSNWIKSPFPCEKEDTDSLSLPGCQEHLITQLSSTGKPVIVVLMNGGPVSCINCSLYASAVLETFYAGQSGPQAIVETLFGLNSPAGRMPYTTYMLSDQLPNFTDYEMAKPNNDGRTYRYISASTAVLHHFGDGLTYTLFKYTQLQSTASIQPCALFNISVTVTNIGNCSSDEVVQVYLYTAPEIAPEVRLPTRSLKSFKRINLEPSQSTTVEFCLSPYALSMVDNTGQRQIYPGSYNFSVGGHQIEGALSFDDVIEGKVSIGTGLANGMSALGSPVPLSSCSYQQLRC
eukprot:scpid49312/ scgid5232/ Probable beta-D-xylosidase 2